jgi:hypothetical protein
MRHQGNDSIFIGFGRPKPMKTDTTNNKKIKTPPPLTLAGKRHSALLRSHSTPVWKTFARNNAF